MNKPVLDSNPEDFVTEFKKVLTQARCRITQARTQVAELLATSEQPLGAYEIHKQLNESGKKADLVSIYRTLDLFKELGLVHYINEAGGFTRCTHQHHHASHSEHIICTECGMVSELSVPNCASNDLLEQIEEIGFQQSSISIEISGTCKDCSEKTNLSQ